MEVELHGVGQELAEVLGEGGSGGSGGGGGGVAAFVRDDDAVMRGARIEELSTN